MEGRGKYENFRSVAIRGGRKEGRGGKEREGTKLSLPQVILITYGKLIIISVPVRFHQSDTLEKHV